jgi:cholesterol oxidase
LKRREKDFGKEDESAPRKQTGDRTRRHFLASSAVGLGVSGLAGKAKAGIFAPTSEQMSEFKQRAIIDYQKNMQAFGGSLVHAPELLNTNCRPGCPWQFDIVVVGSGYGAAITAARLAQKMRPGTTLCMLERGREWVTGTFPDKLRDCMDETRLKIFGRNRRELNNPTGLYNVLQGDDITVLSGSGIGGSSLINAAVAIKPDSEVFLQTQWPNALRDMAFLQPYYDLAAWELHARVEPIDWTCKMRAQRLAAERLSDYQCRFEAAALTVTRSFQGPQLPVLNRHGLIQRDCIDCGDCMTGCNVGAKNTLAYNYLPMARRAGAIILGQTEVRSIEKCNGFYKIHYEYHSRDEKGNHQSYYGCMTSRIVVLGAGSIGSSEILMRSQSDSFVMSKQLGFNWTGNGDALGFVLKSDYETNIRGVGAEIECPAKIGPTIQSNITYPCRPNLHDRVLIQEGSAARSYSNVLGLLMRDLDLDRTLVLLGMGHDRQEGKIVLEDSGNAVVEWPGLLQSDYRRKIRLEFGRIAHGHGGKYKYLRIFGDRMVSVHPLGGCAMSDDPRCGVVNHKGQVYDCFCGGDVDPRTGQMRVHEGLYVNDGAIFPTAIGCNPHLTISALAERNAQLLTREPQFADLFVQE